MTIQALNTAISGLKIAQLQLDNTARNTANVSTPGYTRKILPIETFVAGNIPSGSRAGDLQRYVDTALQRDIWRQVSISSHAETKAGFLDRVQQMHGSPESGDSISAALSELNAAFNALTASPESELNHTDTVNKAVTTALQFNRLSDGIQTQRNDIQGQISETVDRINTILDRIAKLNQSIAEEDAAGRSNVTLLDQRDELVKELSRDMEITYFTRGDSVMIVQTATGRLLADTTAQSLSFTDAPLNFDSVHPGTFDGSIRLSGTTVPFDITQENIGGRLGGLVDMRDQDLPTFQAQLDELAFRTAQRMENAGLQLFVDNRTSDMPVDAAGSYVGFSAHMSVEQVIRDNHRLVRDGFAPVAPPPHGAPAPATAADIGDNSIPLAIVNFAFGEFAGAGPPPVAHTAFNTTGLGPAGANLSTGLTANATLEDYAKNMVVFQSEAHATADRAAEFEGSFLETLEQRFLNESAVDLDEEIADLTVLQKSYSSSARLIQALDEMFDELLAAV